MSCRDSVQIPDDGDFAAFREECECERGWNVSYSKGGVRVWVRAGGAPSGVHSIKCRMECRDVAAATLYDVLHDSDYRRRWDSNVIHSFDIGRLTANADVGYYAWKCPKPLKNRDVVTLRSWLPMGDDFIIINRSVKHPGYPPRKDMVRAVSLRTGYVVRGTGERSCCVTYLAQVDPKGSLPRWVVNKCSQLLAPKAMLRLYRAAQRYPCWKQQHSPAWKPWLYPEQCRLPPLAVEELSLQRSASLPDIDESALQEGGDGSDDDAPPQ